MMVTSPSSENQRPSYSYPWEIEATAEADIRDMLSVVPKLASNIQDASVKARAHTSGNVGSCIAGIHYHHYQGLQVSISANAREKGFEETPRRHL
jgi:hypothetical protein